MTLADQNTPAQAEALVERVARALAKHDGIQICSDASYRHSSYGLKARAVLSTLPPQPDVGALVAALKDAKQSLAVAIYGLPDMLERNALSDEEGMVAALEAAVARMDAALAKHREASDAR